VAVRIQEGLKMAELMTQVNGEVRPLNDAELAQREVDRQAVKQRQAEEAACEAARQSAIDKLAALGLTVDEINALIP
jgi:hypothetical protein